MRYSRMLIPTLREPPTDAEVVSHQLMLRAGMVRQLATGIYSWLPLGLRVLRRVEGIVREEMNRAGAQEVFLPAVLPAELWEESGRWQHYGPELLRLKDRHGREFCIGPTHEEAITDIVRREVRSYKQLPANFYQIQTKFRDEIRPRFGIMRAREFLMKDAYSFHMDRASLQETYDLMFETYTRIFTRLGLHFRAVLADTGNIGGSHSHEFHVLADAGEDGIAYSTTGTYAANVELAPAAAPKQPRPAPSAPMTTVDTPGVRTIADVSAYLKVQPAQILKTLFVRGAEGGLVALVLRGDSELNVIKAGKLPQVAAPVVFADPAAIRLALACDPGSLGPVGLTCPVIVDHTAAAVADFVCGANVEGKHRTGVNFGRDLPEPVIADLRNVVAGDPSPDGNGVLGIARGIEVGHIFQLGDKYSKALKATCLDAEGRAVELVMGCYGIGISRVVAAAIEQSHDQGGIIWPDEIAPFTVALAPINVHKSERLRLVVEGLYAEMQAEGIDVLYHDGRERTGVMFADLDLIGIPHRVVLSDKGLDAGTVEYKHRRESEVRHLPLAELVPFLKAALSGG